MKPCLTLIAVLLVSTAAFADTPVTPPAPALTATEKIAISSLGKEFQKIQQEQQDFAQELHAIEEDVVKNHPGYHLDEKSGNLAPDTPKK